MQRLATIGVGIVLAIMMLFAAGVLQVHTGIDVGEGSGYTEGDIATMLAEGYTSDPTDNCECLYAPEGV